MPWVAVAKRLPSQLQLIDQEHIHDLGESNEGGDEFLRDHHQRVRGKYVHETS